MKDEWKFEPIIIKDEPKKRMVCYQNDFEKLREKILDDLFLWCESKSNDAFKGVLTRSKNWKEMEKIINKRFGVK